MEPVVQMKGITKNFPGVKANDGIDFTLYKGEIHALLGENGAGKTTLMNILYGLYQQDEGEIFIKGKKVKILSPNDAISHGIGMVHQHFMLVEPFTVTENIVLGAEPAKNGVLDLKAAEKQVKELAGKYGLDVDPAAKISDISVGMQQRVEIIKALYKGADILILDEPTAVLTPQEVDELIGIMDNLVKQGKSIIFITHKLKEVMRVSHRVTVIRKGRVIDTLKTRDTSPENLAEKMVGRKVLLRVKKQDKKPGKPILQIKGLKALDNRGIEVLRGVNLEVREGEILGIAGVDGNGQTELVEALTGLRKISHGSIKMLGREISNLNPKEIFSRGVAHIPEDRQKRGLVLEYSIAENLILGKHHKTPFSKGIKINFGSIKQNADKLIKEYDIRTPTEKVEAKTLSGGNQQKVVIAREFSRNPVFIVAAQPTRGLDVGAIEFVHKKLVEMRDQGKGILLISFELDEILSLSDRIAVIYEGSIIGEVSAEKATEEELGLMMAGHKRRDAS